MPFLHRRFTAFGLVSLSLVMSCDLAAAQGPVIGATLLALPLPFAQGQGVSAGSAIPPAKSFTDLEIERQNTQYRINRAGLTGERSLIPFLVKNLERDDAQRLYYDVLQAVGRLGATEALPIIETIKLGPGVISEPRPLEYAKVIRARLIAERAAKVAGGSDKSRVLVQTYLQELGLTAAQLSEKRVSQNMELRGDLLYKVFALRELADIAYHSRNATLVQEARRQGIDFTADEPANLKITLLPLSTEERVNALVADLSTIRALTLVKEHSVQLAIDEGLLASDAAANKIREMLPLVESGERPHAGLVALLRVIGGVGDSRQVPLLQSLKQSTNTRVVYYANQTFPGVSKGEKYRIVLAY